MVRRTIKPFTVEVRHRRGKSLAPASMDEPQPVVRWPAAVLDELRAPPAPMPPTSPTGRILPALDEQPELLTSPVDVAIPIPDAAAALRPTRVGRAVDAPAPEQDLATAVVVVTRPSRPTRPRASFSLGERWKVRLPTAVQRRMRRKVRLNPGQNSAKS